MKAAGPGRNAWPWVYGLGVGAAALGAVWAFRAPLAEFALERALAGRGVPADLKVTALDFGGVTVTGVRLGDPASPDLTIARATAALSWRIVGPRLARLEIDGAALRATMDERGVRLGDLDALRGEPADEPPQWPEIDLRVANSTIALETPWGAWAGAVSAAGVPGRSLVGELDLRSESTAMTGATVSVDVATPDAGGLRARAEASAPALKPAAGVEAMNVSINAEATIPADFGSITAQLSAAADGVALAAGSRLVRPSLEGAAMARLAAGGWSADLRFASPRLDFPHGTAEGATATVSVAGAGSPEITGPVQLNVERLNVADIAGPALFTGRVERDAQAFTVTGALRAPALSVGRAARDHIGAALPDLMATPAGASLAAFENALVGEARPFSLEAPLLLTWGDDGGALWVAGPATLARQDGELVATLTGRSASDAAPARLTLPAGDVSIDAALTLSGPAAPQARVTATLAPTENGVAGRGVVSWRDDARRFTLEETRWDYASAQGRATLSLDGRVRGSGPLAGLEASALEAPVDLTASFGADGVRIAPREAGACASATFEALAGPGVRFGAGQLRLCPRDGVYFALDSRDRATGGVRIPGAALVGETAEGAPLEIRTGPIDAQIGGSAAALELDFAIAEPALSVAFAPDRTMVVRAPALPGLLTLGGGDWSARGRLEGGVVEDPGLPAAVTQIHAHWAATPEDGEVALTFDEGGAALRDKADAPVYQPLRLRDLSGRLVRGVVTAAGDVRLASGLQRLGRLEARHDLETGSGQAVVHADTLRFSPELEAFEVSELARGVVENVEGAINATLTLAWTKAAAALTADVTLQGVSAATAGLGPVRDVSGRIVFDDLAALSTPPGQTLTIGSINPGVLVENGAVRFQLKPGGIVALEAAEFPFSGGVLSVAPTEVVIGAEETRYEVLLRGLDIAAFLAELEIKDLNVTGRLTGAIPVIITPLGGRVENARLTADASGGVIQYTGSLAEETDTGGGQLAFDALKGFRYDQLALTLNGDLDGELVSSIAFSGVNIAPVRPVPMLPTIGRTGLPFNFNVNVRAPFRALVEQAQGTFDPRLAARRSLEADVTTGEPGSPPVQPGPGKGENVIDEAGADGG